MAAVTGDTVERKALELVAHQQVADQQVVDGKPADHKGPVSELLASAGGDRDALAAARNLVAQRLRTNSGDYTATAALKLLNKALVEAGWVDRYDWKIRWTQRLKRP